MKLMRRSLKRWWIKLEALKLKQSIEVESLRLEQIEGEIRQLEEDD